jgi:hypothetical protein
MESFFVQRDNMRHISAGNRTGSHTQSGQLNARSPVTLFGDIKHEAQVTAVTIYHSSSRGGSYPALTLSHMSQVFQVLDFMASDRRTQCSW